ncbi:acyl-CoA hydrolase 2-like [Arachis hypogaea]|uniref:acyl-CoA hydrolase 2-like n=1 Tax=Arachis hypogaea TaxID=3818 RepID=UPI003B21E106
MPIVYKVDHIRDRDGKSFATQRVDATQKENIVFTLLASFQKEELGFDHQEVAMPSMPPPDKLLSMEELRERCLTDPRLPK